MAHIVLTEEQVRAISGSGPLDLRDPSGRLLAVAQPLDAFEAEALERHRRQRTDPSPRPTVPAARVSAMLARLEALDQAGGITPEQVEEVISRVRRGEEP